MAFPRSGFTEAGRRTWRMASMWKERLPSSPTTHHVGVVCRRDFMQGHSPHRVSPLPASEDGGGQAQGQGSSFRSPPAPPTGQHGKRPPAVSAASVECSIVVIKILIQLGFSHSIAVRVLQTAPHPAQKTVAPPTWTSTEGGKHADAITQDGGGGTISKGSLLAVVRRISTILGNLLNHCTTDKCGLLPDIRKYRLSSI